MTANYAQNQNKLESLYGKSDTYLIGSKFFNVSIEARVGQPYGSIVGRDSAAIPSSGKQVLSGSSGAPLAALTTSRSLATCSRSGRVASSTPSATRASTLSGQIDARIGGQLYSATNAWGKYAGILEETLEGP